MFFGALAVQLLLQIGDAMVLGDNGPILLCDLGFQGCILGLKLLYALFK
jgi:hypothetical protein